MGFLRKAGADKKSDPKRLFVHPSELADKLIKELEDHKSWEGTRAWAPARYAVYLCAEDYDRLSRKLDKVRRDLVRQLYEHVEDMGYELEDDIAVEIVLDEELPLGRFGILTQSLSETPSVASPIPPVTETPRPASAAGNAVAPGSAGVAEGLAGMARLQTPVVHARKEQGPAGVQTAGQVAERVIVVRIGDEVREFRGSRVVIGRGRDVDCRIDDPGVSRRHAAIFLEGDKLMVEDLGSTNGTLVNGYPVTKTVLGPRDVVVVGQRRLRVEVR